LIDWLRSTRLFYHVTVAVHVTVGLRLRLLPTPLGFGLLLVVGLWLVTPLRYVTRFTFVTRGFRFAPVGFTFVTLDCSWFTFTVVTFTRWLQLVTVLHVYRLRFRLHPFYVVCVPVVRSLRLLVPFGYVRPLLRYVGYVARLLTRLHTLARFGCWLVYRLGLRLVQLRLHVFTFATHYVQLDYLWLRLPRFTVVYTRVYVYALRFVTALRSDVYVTLGLFTFVGLPLLVYPFVGYMVGLPLLLWFGCPVCYQFPFVTLRLPLVCHATPHFGFLVYVGTFSFTVLPTCVTLRLRCVTLPFWTFTFAVTVTFDRLFVYVCCVLHSWLLVGWFACLVLRCVLVWLRFRLPPFIFPVWLVPVTCHRSLGLRCWFLGSYGFTFLVGLGSRLPPHPHPRYVWFCVTWLVPFTLLHAVAVLYLPGCARLVCRRYVCLLVVLRAVPFVFVAFTVWITCLVV